jgi:hypothetical protein
MKNTHIFKFMHEYTPIGRSIGHPTKRWKDRHKQEGLYPAADELINVCYKYNSSDSSVICPEI